MKPDTANTYSENASFIKDAERLRFALNAAGIGVWEVDLATNTVIWDDRCRELFGLAKNNIIPYEQAIKFIHPDDKAGVDQRVQAALQGENGGAYDAIYRTIGADDGMLRWVNFSGMAFFDKAGNIARFGGIAQDFTEKILRQEAEKIKGAQLLEAQNNSEARFRSLVENAPMAICLFVGKGYHTIELANDAMLKVWGKDASVIGKPLLEALPELEGQPFNDILDQIYDTGQPFFGTGMAAQLEVNGVLGTYYYNFAYQPLFDNQGKVYAIMDIALDVTEQILSRKQLEEAELTLRAAIDMAQLATWSIDVTTNCITYSPRLQEWLGVKEGVLNPEGSPNVVEADRERIRLAIQKALEPGGPGEMDEVFTVINRHTGQKRIIRTNGRTIVSNEGKPLVLTGTAQDVTIQQELQMALENEVQLRTRELAQSNQELLRSNEELTQFAYIASHDLQEPLRKIQMFTSVLGKSYEVPKSLVQTISKIQNSTGRMSALIRDLLDFSQLLKGDKLFGQVDLNEVVYEVQRDYELMVAEKGALFHVENMPTVQAVPFQMQQLFYNLIGNALKFAGADNGPVIHICCRREEEMSEETGDLFKHRRIYHITVSDNGIGFEQEYANRIFEVFKRLHSREQYAGTGIGLALCKRIVENHRGRIWAESSPGQGARFHILLPADSP